MNANFLVVHISVYMPPYTHLDPMHGLLGVASSARHEAPMNNPAMIIEINYIYVGSLIHVILLPYRQS